MHLTSGQPPTGSNLALNKPATASSVEADAYPASAAVDASTTTRWSSQFADPQWLQIDLGQTYTVERVRLTWEAAYGTAYQIQVSPDGQTWTTARTITNGDGGTDDLTGLDANGRYIRMYGTTRATEWGYSLFNLEVFGDAPPALSNVAAGKPATASSVEADAYPASAAVDASTTTRWSSQFADPQWLQIDLGQTYTVERVRLTWEAAYGTAYQIQVSPDGQTWTTARTITNGDGGTDDLTGLDATGRYIRMYGTTRATEWGYSLFNLEVFGR
ncbi:discoidin domain-containing protein [Solwaraspora sp. WMMD406]|nr:discoidin domain-containing protein [Solwaraspora sp. WMMD406]MDG4765876.1 discoidin domain-containing protein [Solwaraspora sp. WMMD406]